MSGSARGNWMAPMVIGWSMLLASPALAQTGASSKPLRIGVVKSLFRNMPDSLIQIISRPLQALLETQTGLTGRVEGGSEAGQLGQMLHEGKVDLAIFHGFEFAWVKDKYPDLLPLVLVTNQRPLQACLVVHKNGQVRSIQDLKGKYLALPSESRGHCHLFLERRCCPADRKPAAFLKKVTTPSDAANALEDVHEGLIGGAIVERGAYEEYCRSWPQRGARLKVLLQSEIFPPGVIAYHARKLPAEIVRRVREGMINANQTKEGKDLLDLCRMTGFETAPADYLKALQDIAQAYPDPEAR